MNSKAELAKAIYDTCHLTGQFTLRSGQISNEYFDKYRFESNPKLLMQIAEQLSNLIPSGTEVLAGLEMGGIPIATALSIKTGIPIAFIRKEPKTYGTCKFAEGLDLAQKKICIVEDVITSGGQVILSANDIRSLKAEILGVVCVINRGGEKATETLKSNQLELFSLFQRIDFPN